MVCVVHVKICLTIAMLVSLIIPLAVYADSGRYYVYEFERVVKEFKNSEKTFETTFRIVLRYEIINDTAYRIELVEYNAPSEYDKKAVEHYLTWMNETSGMVKPIRDTIEASLPPVTLEPWTPPIWIEPHILAETKEAVTKINNALNELCSTTDPRQRAEKLWNLFNSRSSLIAAFLFPSIHNNIILIGTKEGEFLCKGGFRYTAEETENTYVFRASLSKASEKGEGVAVYSKQGWLVYMDYKETRIINSTQVLEDASTVRLVNTNDPALASATKGGIQPSQASTQIVVMLTVAGLIAVLGAIATKILMKQIKR